MVLVAEGGNGDVALLCLLRLVAAFALENLTVQRGSRSFWHSLAGLPFHASGTLPALMSAFSASELRCFGAATMVASTICPPMAR